MRNAIQVWGFLDNGMSLLKKSKNHAVTQRTTEHTLIFTEL